MAAQQGEIAIVWLRVIFRESWRGCLSLREGRRRRKPRGNHLAWQVTWGDVAEGPAGGWGLQEELCKQTCFHLKNAVRTSPCTSKRTNWAAEGLGRGQCNSQGRGDRGRWEALGSLVQSGRGWGGRGQISETKEGKGWSAWAWSRDSWISNPWRFRKVILEK